MRARIVLLLVVGIALASATTPAASAAGAPEAAVFAHPREAVVGEVQEFLRNHHADVFGGLVAEADGTTVLSFTNRAAALTEVVRSLYPDLPLRHRTVERSEAELNRLLLQAVEDRRLLTASTGPYDVATDLRGNGLLFTVMDPSDHVRHTFEARYPAVPLQIGGGVSIPEACLTKSSCNPLRAGVVARNTTLGNRCSTGFVGVYSTPAGVNAAILTAGHCTDVTYERYENGVGRFMGYAVRRQESGNADVALIDFEGNFASSNWVYNSISKQSAVTSVQTYSAAFVGQSVCRSGTSEPDTCGVVESTNVAPNFIPGGIQFLRANYCADGGDSGGPVYSGGQAIGIHSGGPSRSSGEAKNCSDGDDFGIYGHIEHQMSAMNMSLRTG